MSESLNGFLHAVSAVQRLLRPPSPIRIEYNGGMTSEQWYPLRQTSFFAGWDDRKCATAAAIPVYRDVLRICLSPNSARCLSIFLTSLTLTRFVSHAFLDTRTLS
jgi:hypothetical protein